MINLNNIAVYFGGEVLFENITFLINERDRIGLVGKNGAGKSTLLKIIAGAQNPTEGSLSLPRNCRIGFLTQDLKTKSEHSVFDEALTAFKEIKELERNIADLEHRITTTTTHNGDEYMQWLDDLNEANERLHLLGAANMNEETEKVLLGLGFERDDFIRPLKQFSGGWQMRVELAKLLLSKPNLLLLDEPTNHLDIESIAWLESFMKDFSGAIILVSHDKRFLDNVTSRTIEITNNKIEDYKANYTKYVTLRKERRATLLAAQRNQQREIERTEQLIEKFRAKANKAKFAQSLIKQLERTERIEIEDDDNAAMRFRFPDAPRSGVSAIRTEHLFKAYGDKKVLNEINFDIQRGDRVAFVGRNGEGKTTLAKMLVGDEKATSGEIIIGHNVNIGYYAQHQAEKLDGNETVFDTVDKKAFGEVRTRVRSLLGAFLFGGNDIDKKVKVLSGGEKSRLALACLLLEPHNVLVMDEPTNHLDMRSKDILKEALLNFNGTLIVVSHDRDFLQGLTNKLFYFRAGVIKEHLGDIDDFMASRNIESLHELERKQNIKNNTVKVVGPQQDKDLKKLDNQILKSEKKIEELEAQLKQVENELSQSGGKEIEAKVSIYNTYKAQLDSEMKQWEDLNAQRNNILSNP
ncbi:MAG: ATP-binding cassette domain-containing protein [Bacteroidetes bacterium]|nr:ATP-binding cassette domain-containing protein [Bacteroidota bacterium]